jgi:hypothetical protein
VPAEQRQVIVLHHLADLPGPLVLLGSVTGSVQGIALSPDGRMLAISIADPADPADTQLIQVIVPASGATRTWGVLSPDGRQSSPTYSRRPVPVASTACRQPDTWRSWSRDAMP